MTDTDNNNLSESNYRSAIKAFTWRIIGSLDTTLISLFQTGDFIISLKIGSTDFLSKIVLYYLHERAWIYFLGQKTLTPMISLAKAVAWRSIGSIDTAFWGWIYTGDIMTGLKIGGYELLTKILLYYIHERIWARVPIGSIRRVMDRVRAKLK